ncbi:hypothetical protein [Luteimonas salinilitoris]|uniref:Uncharacterized protein n=1 Tax=Luteimonas salinilitoris TaxID=3237697 RepID=A0ABV4HZJ0_9GAMM
MSKQDAPEDPTHQAITAAMRSADEDLGKVRFQVPSDARLEELSHRLIILMAAIVISMLLFAVLGLRGAAGLLLFGIPVMAMTILFGIVVAAMGVNALLTSSAQFNGYHLKLQKTAWQQAAVLADKPDDVFAWQQARDALDLARNELRQWFGFVAAMAGLGLALYVSPRPEASCGIGTPFDVVNAASERLVSAGLWSPCDLRFYLGVLLLTTLAVVPFLQRRIRRVGRAHHLAILTLRRLENSRAGIEHS